MTKNPTAFSPTTTQQKYLVQQLEKVSRSFALLIPYIESPLRHYLGVAYLLCRVADNIEDCTQPLLWKQARFDEFALLLDEPARAAGQLAEWERQPWPGLTADERQMMGIGLGLPLWQLYGAIPRSSQGIIRRWVGAMVKGMRGIGDPQTRPAFVRRKGIEVLESELDYNEYCYYVAGTVGQLASELVVEQYQLAPEVAARLHARAESCGRSLQKTNIIKDFVEDLNRGVCYLPDTWMGHAAYAPLELGGAELPWKAMVLGDALNEMRDSMAYVLALPVHAKGYRRASLMCLYPAYHTMLSAARQADLLFTAGHRIKISRMAIAQCISDSDKTLLDNDAIQTYCAKLEGAIFDCVGAPVALRPA
ncbi:MAG: squalene/phytoene synthase family protein [Anaerolineales bacterium]|nr:squalene/phytoene synthase family protein [Anaerolineales bacterium]